jgi:hypothetical protein
MRIALVLLAGCYALPPAPLLPPHTDAAPNSIGTDTAMLIVGGATDFSGQGYGAALRFEHQDTDRTTYGAELSGGVVERGSVGGKSRGELEQSHALVGLRGYTRYSESGHFAIDGGLGVSVLGTGLVTGTVDSGILFSRPSGTFVPVGAIDVAFSQPLHNVKFDADTVDYFKVPASRGLFIGFDFDGIVPITENNRLSFDLGWIWSFPTSDDNDGDFLFSSTYADIARVH